jgi:hypothetical protein
VRGRSRFKPNRYRAERMRALTRRVDFLEAELRRVYELLGLTLRVAAGQDHDPLVLFAVIADAYGFDLARSALAVEQERERRARGIEETAALIHETSRVLARRCAA